MINVYLEIGKKRTFAVALDWPGWCRSGRDTEAALQVLCDYGPRFQAVLHSTSLAFQPPTNPSEFVVIERLNGNASTDFGAPGIIPLADAQPVSEVDLQRFEELLIACWKEFDKALSLAVGKELRKGPRGGGRDADKITQHVLQADAAYLGRIGVKFKIDEQADLVGEIQRSREAMLAGLAALLRGEIPAKGPRGGARWSAAYFVRRVAWHVLDHAWEIEDRIL